MSNFCGLVEVDSNWAVKAAQHVLDLIQAHREQLYERLVAQKQVKPWWRRKAYTREEAIERLDADDLALCKLRYGRLKQECESIVRAAIQSTTTTMFLKLEVVSTLKEWEDDE